MYFLGGGGAAHLDDGFAFFGVNLYAALGSHSNPLECILSISLQSMLKDREGKEDENSSIFQLAYVMQWFEGDIKITIMSAIYFST